MTENNDSSDPRPSSKSQPAKPNAQKPKGPIPGKPSGIITHGEKPDKKRTVTTEDIDNEKK